MNLYIQALVKYLKDHSQLSLNVNDAPKEARFVVQSLDADSTFDLFQELEKFLRGKLFSGEQTINYYLRVAAGLWKDWLKTSSQEELLEKLQQHGGHSLEDWIDLGDRLTWYRNRTAADDETEGLVVVMVGLNHATDQGGLKDFHIVDQSVIWREMGGHFIDWIQDINTRYALNGNPKDCEQLDIVLRRLFEVRPLQLARMADFLQQVLNSKKSWKTFSEFIQAVFEHLPFWDIAPLIANGDQKLLVGKKGADKISEAADFLSHQRYKSASAQRQAWQKLEAMLEDENFSLPKVVGAAAFENKAEYQLALYNFIHKADQAAHARLLHSDLLPVLTALKLKAPKEKKATTSSNKLIALQGASLEVWLQALWRALASALPECKTPLLSDSLQRLELSLERFEHDLSADDDEGEGEHALAERLLRGCLGGVERQLQGLQLNMPADYQQLQLAPSHWTRTLALELAVDFSKVSYVSVSGSKTSNVQFKVCCYGADSTQPLSELSFKWILGATHPERVRFDCARLAQHLWAQQPTLQLPGVTIQSVALDALYYAADEEEAHRLLTQALADLRLVDLCPKTLYACLDPSLQQQLQALSAAYQLWLDAAVQQGYYAAQPQLAALIQHYSQLAQAVQLSGANELLNRLYKAFLLFDSEQPLENSYLPNALVWGITPALLEISYAQARFLQHGASELFSELAVLSAPERMNVRPLLRLERLLSLAHIQRPIAVLAVDAQNNLSAAMKSFGLLQYLGQEPKGAKSLAVQTLLRDQENQDGDDVSESVQDCEESALVQRVLLLYQRLYPYAADGVRLLALNVKQLPSILSGLDRFLRDYLKGSSREQPAFHCQLMVYSSDASPLAIERRLGQWRDQLLEQWPEEQRGLVLTVAHRYAPPDKQQVQRLLQREAQLYDIAFLFHFLRAELQTEAQKLPARALSATAEQAFPLSECPLPINPSQPLKRRSKLSNRLLRLKTQHANLSAKLRFKETHEYAIYGTVDYYPWQAIVDELHQRAQWVACIDAAVDKHLLGGEAQDGRKIIGFSSGLGSHGELNLTLSTEQDTLQRLEELVAARLGALLPQVSDLATLAKRVVRESEQVIGLASLQAVVGQDERIREVIGFAAIQRLLAAPAAQMAQLVPLDTLSHWFEQDDQRPDLLHLSLQVRPNQPPLLHAWLLECKFAFYSATHVQKAREQIQQGLARLLPRFAPRHSMSGVVQFEQRYWWGQLQRALTSRAKSVGLAVNQETLEYALEQLLEGEFEIAWQAAICTFWVDDAASTLRRERLAIDPALTPTLNAPAGLTIQHLSLGYPGVVALFNDANPPYQLQRQTSSWVLCAEGAASVEAVEAEVAAPVVNALPQGAARVEAVEAEVAAPVVNALPLGAASVEAVETEVAAPVVNALPQGAASVEAVETEVAAPVVSALPQGAASVEAVEAEVAAPVVNVLPQEAADVEAVDTATWANPAQVLIGNSNNGTPVYWHFGHPQLNNRHLLIFGSSGSGKTYGIQCLLAELAQQRLNSLIVDYTDGFLNAQVDQHFTKNSGLRNLFVFSDGLPLNPFRRQTIILDQDLPPMLESPFNVAARVQTLVASVYELGEQQKSVLIDVIQSGLEISDQFGLEDLLNELQQNPHTSAQSLLNKLRPLVNTKPFRPYQQAAWEELLLNQRHRVNVVQLKAIARDLQRIITEFVLWDLWDYAQSSGNKQRPIPLVLDEIQNLDHSQNSPLNKMLREGRKFGLSLMLATQTASQFTQEQRDCLFQAGHKLFFKPANTEVANFAALLAPATGITRAEWEKRLNSLSRGQCWSLGPVLKGGGQLQEEAVLVHVTALERRLRQRLR